MIAQAYFEAVGTLLIEHRSNLAALEQAIQSRTALEQENARLRALKGARLGWVDCAKGGEASSVDGHRPVAAPAFASDASARRAPERCSERAHAMDNGTDKCGSS